MSEIAVLDAINNDLPSIGEGYRNQARALRPFYFIVVAWGERFTLLLLDFCIASLLSPNNIPALLNSGNKFLIATTDEDWDRMQSHPIFQLLKQYVEPVFLRIPPFGAESNKYVHMGIGHKLATQMAYEHRAYGVVLTPDGVLSDGTMVALQRHAMDGTQVVLTAGLRFGEEPLLEHLKQLGIAQDRKGEPLILTSRQLVWAGYHSMHSETLSFEWERPNIFIFPSAIWWRVPEEDGMLVHSLSWAPLLMDYAAVESHDTWTIENWTIDGDYIHRNFGPNRKVHVVQDSDKIMLMTYGPIEEGEIPTSKFDRAQELMRNIFGNLEKEMIMCNTFFHPCIDPLKREIFSKPVRWHATEINDQWNLIEDKAKRVVRNIVGASPITVWFFSIWHPKLHVIVFRMAWLGIRIVGLGNYMKSISSYYWSGRQNAARLLIEAIRGDSAAQKRVKQSLKGFANHFRKIL